MHVLLFGATGMVGKGVLLECLDDPAITRVTAVVRKPLGLTHAKLRELIHADFTRYDGVDLSGVDACFFCLGVSSAGMSEADYTRVTYDFTMAAANALKAQSPSAAFTYVSGLGTDSSERGGSMWARVKGRTENAVLALFPERSWMFRPGFIQPLRGVTSSTRLYRAAIAIARPIFPVVKALAPNAVTTSVAVGRAMIRCVRSNEPKRVLEPADINRLAALP